MNNLRIVLDANVFNVSLSSNFQYHKNFEFLINGKYDLYITNEILTEYEEQIVKRYGLANTTAKLDFLLLLPNVFTTIPYFKWNLINSDPDDNKYSDCAIISNADFLVTNDKHFNILKTINFPKLNVINAIEFLKKLHQ